jgi:CRP/FNR family transcriptional regulator
MEDLEILRKISMFSELDDSSLLKISDILHRRNYKKGKIIFMEGEPGDAFYFVLSGGVKLYNTASDGREHIIHIFGRGNVFGEVTLFNDTGYPATAEVLEDSAIGMIRNEELENLIRQDSSLALELIRVLNRRLLMASVEIRNMAFNDTVQRTAAALIKLSESHGIKTSRGIELDLDITRQELADVAGTARETVIRALTRLKKDGAVEMDGSIVIKDINKLADWVK